MTDAAPADSSPASRRQIWFLTVVVFVFQLGLIFWLGDYKPIITRSPRRAPTLNLAADADPELLALYDPTHFALPRKEGFAGLAWLTPEPPAFPRFGWSEPLIWLEVTTNQLGAGFNLFAETNLVTTWQTPVLPEPNLLLHSAELVLPPVPSRSTLRVEGDPPVPVLASSIDLPSWPPRVLSPSDQELLTNTVVQALVNQAGEPVSVTLLGTGSGSREADEYALKTVSSARFLGEKRDNSPPADMMATIMGLRWCQLIFEWHTVPGPVTNTPPAVK